MEVTDKAGELTCVICCSSHPHDFVFGGEEMEENHPRMTRKGGIKRNEKDVIKQQRQPCQEKPDLAFQNFCRELLSIRKLELERGLSVCSSCIANVGLALESKRKVDKVEARVRKLQMSLLLELRELEGHVEGLQEHMRRFEDYMKGSDENRSGIHFKKGKTPSDVGRNDALFFRQCLSNVSKDFRSFRSELRRKVLLDQVNPTSQPTSDSSNSTHSNNCTEISADIKIEAEDEAMPIEPKEFLEDFDSLSVPPPKTEVSEHAFLLSGEDISEQHQDDDFEPPLLPPPSKSKGYQKRTVSKAKQLANMGLKGLSDFKKYLIKALVLSGVAPQTKSKLDPEDDNMMGGDSVVDEIIRKIGLERTQSPIEFNPDKGNFLFKGVEIQIDEQTKTLKCSRCSYSFKPKWRRSKNENTYGLKKIVKNHVMGQHANGFQCPLCENKYTSYKYFCRHLRIHENPHNCPVCQRPLASSEGIEIHMWTHKSAEEKAEAMQKEEDKIRLRINPTSTSEDVPSEGVQCSTCGKSFKDKKYLAIHEKRHKSKAHYAKILCPDCGLYIPKLKFRYHKESVCLPKNSPMVKCIQCERSFKTIAKMQVHLKRHSMIERPHQCDICQPSRNFRSLPELKVHMKIHSEVRPFDCTKGCGRNFAVKRNWKRHEVTCKGVRRKDRTIKIKTSIKVDGRSK